MSRVPDPRTLSERKAVAALCSAELALPFPVVVDDLMDRTARAYGAWPVRAFVVGTDGRLLYRGRPGPAGYELGEFSMRLEEILTGATNE